MLPGWQFWNYVNHLDKLKAEAEIAYVGLHRMGAGSLDQRDYQSLARELETRARGDRSTRPTRPKSISDLKAIGGTKVVLDSDV